MKQNRYQYAQSHQEENKNSWVAEYKHENNWLYLFAFGLLIVPMVLGNQLIIGTIVNALLIGSAVKFKTKKVLILSIIPSIAAFSAGILFGNLTHQVLLMMPFIWAGNIALMLVVKKLFAEQRKNYFYTLTAGATGKTIILFASALMLTTAGLAPIIVLTAFGIMQFATAIAGGIIYFGAEKIAKRIA